MAKRRSGGAARGGIATLDGDDLRQRVAEDPDSVGDMEDHEVRWLQDHGLLPDEWERVPVTFFQNGEEVSNDPNYFASQRLQDEERFNAEVERRAQALAKEMVQSQQHENHIAGTEYTGNAVGMPQQGGNNAGFEPDNSAAGADEEAEDYNSWHADELRAELSRRELSVSGNKAALVDRLESDDQGLSDEGEEEE